VCWNGERFDHLLDVERLNLHHACLGIGRVDKAVILRSRQAGKHMSVSFLMPCMAGNCRTGPLIASRLRCHSGIRFAVRCGSTVEDGLQVCTFVSLQLTAGVIRIIRSGLAWVPVPRQLLGSGVKWSGQPTSRCARSRQRAQPGQARHPHFRRPCLRQM
jgi:hypothetical protein